MIALADVVRVLDRLRKGVLLVEGCSSIWTTSQGLLLSVKPWVSGLHYEAFRAELHDYGTARIILAKKELEVDDFFIGTPSNADIRAFARRYS